jgi:hypothetical protein
MKQTILTLPRKGFGVKGTGGADGRSCVESLRGRFNTNSPSVFAVMPVAIGGRDNSRNKRCDPGRSLDEIRGVTPGVR